MIGVGLFKRRNGLAGLVQLLEVDQLFRQLHKQLRTVSAHGGIHIAQDIQRGFLLAARGKCLGKHEVHAGLAGIAFDGFARRTDGNLVVAGKQREPGLQHDDLQVVRGQRQRLLKLLPGLVRLPPFKEVVRAGDIRGGVFGALFRQSVERVVGLFREVGFAEQPRQVQIGFGLGDPLVEQRAVGRDGVVPLCKAVQRQGLFMLELHVAGIFLEHSTREVMDLVPRAEFFLELKQRLLDVLPLGLKMKDLAIGRGGLRQSVPAIALLVEAGLRVPFERGGVFALPVEVEGVPAGGGIPIAFLKGRFRFREPLAGLVLPVQKEPARAGEAQNHQYAQCDKRDRPQSA